MQGRDILRRVDRLQFILNLMHAARSGGGSHDIVHILSQDGAAQMDPAPIGTNLYGAGVTRQASEIGSHPFFQDPIRRALIAQLGAHLCQDAASSVARVFHCYRNGIIQSVYQTVCLVTYQRPPAISLLWIEEIHQSGPQPHTCE